MSEFEAEFTGIDVAPLEPEGPVHYSTWEIDETGLQVAVVTCGIERDGRQVSDDWEQVDCEDCLAARDQPVP